MFMLFAVRAVASSRNVARACSSASPSHLCKNSDSLVHFPNFLDISNRYSLFLQLVLMSASF